MYGKTHSEVFSDFLAQLTTPEALAQFGKGFISYPDDMRWALYGAASWANLLGPVAKAKSHATIAAVKEAIFLQNPLEAHHLG